MRKRRDGTVTSEADASKTPVRSLSRDSSLNLTMRAVIQRVSSASVTIAGQTTAAIHHGLLVLLGIEEGDAADDVEWLSGKLVRLRIFNDDQDVMNRSVQETG